MNKKSCTTHDVQEYLIDKNNKNNLSPLEWWRVNGGKYRNVARELRESGWQFRQLPLQVVGSSGNFHSNCRISSEYRLKRKYSATTIY